MTTVNKHKILKNLPIFLSAGLILAAGFVFVHFSAKNKNPGQGEVLGQNTLTQTTAQTSLSENTAYGEKSAALQPTPAPESAADQQANKPNAALPDAGKKPDVEHELIPGDPLIRGGGGTGSTNFRGGSGGGGGGGITAGTGTASGYVASTPQNISVTVAAGSNIALFVGIGTHGGQTVSSVTYNGVGMTKLWDQYDGCSCGTERSSAWILINPSTGSNTLHIVWSANPGSAEVWAQPFYGVSQTGGEGGSWRTPSFGNDGGSGSATASQTVSGAQSGDMVVDVLADFNQSPTKDASQTIEYGPNQPGGGSLYWGVSSKLATGATTMQWTMTSTYWALGAVALIPAVSGTSGSVKFR